MANQDSPFGQFQHLLREMFQFDHNELDFGLFKVLRLKRTYIEQFISGEGAHDLKHIVAQELESIRGADTEDERKWLANRCEMIGIKAKTAWASVAATPQDPALQTKLTEVIQLLEDEAQVESTQSRLTVWLQTQAYSTSHLEAQLYNYLLNYFELYYQNGDFGYNARATSAFKVPYEADYDGADTLFHWKHKDCYYIKTANSFPEVRLEVMGKTVVFRLQAGGDADTAAQNNNKDTDIKQYRLADIIQQDGEWLVRFQLAKAGTPKAEIYTKLWNAALGASTDLAPYLTHKSPDGDKSVFKDLGKNHDKAEGGQIKGINQLRLSEDAYLDAIAKNETFKALGKNAEARTEALKNDATARALHQLDKALNRFYVGQDADYFIHKDLRGFLTREKERFIKNVVFSNLEALLDRRADAATLIIARAFNTVAGRIIEFLDATETFQRNLFTMKKKVIDTHWLISVGKIPAAYWPRLLQNQRLLAYFQSEFKQTVASVDDLQAQSTLVVDTSLFTTPDERALIDELLSDPAFDNLDEQTDGLLIHSENWQALNLLQEKFRERIKCIYIDPPYNTGGDGFLYKDSFRHSSWAAMMADRLAISKNFLNADGVLFASIDDKERLTLERLLGETFGPENRVEELIWAQNSTKNQSPTYSNNHEYVEVFARSLERVRAAPNMFREVKPGYLEVTELLEQLNPNYPSIAEIEAAIAKLYDEHRETFKAELEEQGVEYERNLDPWKGTYSYCNAEYRTKKSQWVQPSKAQEEEAQIRLWMSDNAAIPKGGGTDNKKGVHTLGDPDYRFYRPAHSGKNYPHPKSGWRFPENPIGLSTSFLEMDADFRIDWPSTEKNVPRLKKFLHEVDTAVAKSIVNDFTDGEKELTHVMGKQRSFPNPKPTSLIGRFVEQTTEKAEWVMDFFAGSGTAGHAVMGLDTKRRFVLSEMGGYFDTVTKPRIARIMFSPHWKNGEPGAASRQRGIVKVQRFEQYEDVIANLDTAWDDAALPEGVPVRYLFRPEENRVRMSLDLSHPFTNTIRVGKAREATPLDLLETWAFLQGYWQRSRRVVLEGDKRYLCLETVCGCLIILRDITEPEEDSAALNTIAARYLQENGGLRIHRLEVNHWADLRRVTLPCTLIGASDFDRGAAWN
jgi:adenine-specific DNA-methyltransferase